MINFKERINIHSLLCSSILNDSYIKCEATLVHNQIEKCLKNKSKEIHDNFKKLHFSFIINKSFAKVLYVVVVHTLDCTNLMCLAPIETYVKVDILKFIVHIFFWSFVGFFCVFLFLVILCFYLSRTNLSDGRHNQ